MKKRYIKYVQCRGGCGKTLATGIRLGSAKNREKYAGYCDNCMPPETQKQMQADSLAHMQKKLDPLMPVDDDDAREMVHGPDW